MTYFAVCLHFSPSASFMAARTFYSASPVVRVNDSSLNIFCKCIYGKFPMLCPLRRVTKIIKIRETFSNAGQCIPSWLELELAQAWAGLSKFLVVHACWLDLRYPFWAWFGISGIAILADPDNTILFTKPGFQPKLPYPTKKQILAKKLPTTLQHTNNNQTK